MIENLRLIGADELREAVSFGEAISVIRRGAQKLDLSAQLERRTVPLDAGQLLLMPAEANGYVGCKVISVAPGNSARGLARIQGLFLLFDGETLAPLALFDGAQLTALRTPAVSACFVDFVAPVDARTLSVIGTGVQAIGHVCALREVRSIEAVRIVGRTAQRAEGVVRALAALGIEASAASLDEALTSDLVVCATNARTPLFDRLPADSRATVVAIGSHERQARELPGSLLGEAQVFVESLEIARTEAGDVIQAIDAGWTREEDLVTLSDLAAGANVEQDRVRVIKTCGTGWQDLAVASAAADRLLARPGVNSS